jgi:PKHD-type hydroxylase
MLMTIDHVLSTDEVRQFRTYLDTAAWQDGNTTAGSLGRHVKHNEQLASDDPVAVDLGNRILQRLGQTPAFIAAALPKLIYPPRFNRYSGGGTYGTHVDNAVMPVPRTQTLMRSDVSATLFLAGPDEYEGGELQIETAFGIQSVKLAAGDMVLYPSSSMHCVTPVTSGARVASFFWIQSMVADEGERTMLYDLDNAIQELTAAHGANNTHVLTLAGIYHNLLRRWAVT